METIFVGIPSMADTETSATVRNAIESAEFPERVFIGVSFKDLDKKEYSRVLALKEEYPNINVEFIKLKKRDVSQYGTGDGRYRAQQLYSGQDYMLQVDSHTYFDKNWDSYLIKSFKEFKKETNIEKFVLTSYIPYYSYSPEGKRKRHEGDSFLPRYPYFVVDEFFLQYLPKWEDRLISKDFDSQKFVPCVKFNGAFAFGDKNFIKNTGVFKDAIFYDEELIQGINLIGDGFSLVFLNVKDFPIAHLYGDDINEFGGERTYFGDLLSSKKQMIVADKAVSNYLNFILDPENSEKIKKYEKYAKMDVRKGPLLKRYVPKNFIVGDEYE
jgi:hypothetical protein